MNPFDTRALNDFYVQISAEGGVSVTHLQAELTRLFEQSRSARDLKDYRLSKPPWKKLSDEVIPASRFLRFLGIESGRIRFPLNDHPPDAWLWQGSGNDRVGIEVTIAQATERFHLAKELVTTGQGRGFIGVSDDAPPTEFDRVLSRPRVMYSTGHALSAVRGGIRRCLSRKNELKFAGFILLIQAPLRSLPHERWDAIRDDLCAAAAPLPFREVYVISNAGQTPWGFQIKSSTG